MLLGFLRYILYLAVPKVWRLYQQFVRQLIAIVSS